MIETHKYEGKNKYTIITTLAGLLDDASFSTFMRIVEQYAKQDINPLNWLPTKDNREMLVVFSDGSIVSIEGFSYRDLRSLL